MKLSKLLGADQAILDKADETRLMVMLHDPASGKRVYYDVKHSSFLGNLIPGAPRVIEFHLDPDPIYECER